MKLTIFQVATASKKEKLRELSFSLRPAEDDAVVDEAIHLPGAEPVGVKAVYWNANLTVLVTQGARHVATMMCGWRDVTPHFAVRLPGGEFLEFYFEK